MKVPVLASPIWREWFLLLVRGPLGILGPILVLLLLLWLTRGEHSPWYVKAALLVALVVLILIMLGS